MNNYHLAKRVDRLSSNLFSGIESLVDDLVTEIEEWEQRVDGLEKEIEELKSKLEEQK